MQVLQEMFSKPPADRNKKLSSSTCKTRFIIGKPISKPVILVLLKYQQNGLLSLIIQRYFSKFYITLLCSGFAELYIFKQMVM